MLGLSLFNGACGRRACVGKRSAIWFLGGGLLMLPPMGTDEGVQHAVPITQWEQAEAFDTAQACEKARNKYYLEAIRSGASVPAKRRTPGDQVDARVDASRLRRGLCVPPNAVYPCPTK